MLDLEKLLAESKHKKTLDMIRNNWSYLGKLSPQTPDQIELALSIDPYAIGFVRGATQEMMMRCLDEDINCWRFIPQPTPDVVSRVREYFNCTDEWFSYNQWFQNSWSSESNSSSTISLNSPSNSSPDTGG